VFWLSWQYSFGPIARSWLAGGRPGKHGAVLSILVASRLTDRQYATSDKVFKPITRLNAL
jgi:hypothetical protein